MKLLLILMTTILKPIASDKPVDSPIVNAVRYKTHIEMVSPDRTVTKNDAQLDIIKVKNFMIYRVPIYMGKPNTKHTEKETVTEVEITDSVENYSYFLQKSGDENAYYFPLGNIEQMQKDQGSKLLGNYIGNREAMFHGDNFLKISTEQIEADNVEIIRYVPKRKLDDSYCDSTYIYLKKIPNKTIYSIAPKLEEVTGKTAIKAVMMFNDKKDALGQLIAPRRQIYIEVSENNLDLPESVLKMVEKVQSQNH